MMKAHPRSGDDVEYRFDICLESLHGLQPKEGCTYSVKWRRGEKWVGKTDQFGGSQMGIIVMNHKISFVSTIQRKDRTRYHKKIIEFFVNELSTRKGKPEKRRLAEMKADLSETINCTNKTLVLKDQQGGGGALMVSVTSTPASNAPPVGLAVPQRSDVDSHTDVAATSADGHSEVEDPGTASVADDSEASPPPRVVDHLPKPVPKPLDDQRAPGKPAFASAHPAPKPSVLDAVPSAITLDLERRLREAESRVRVLEAERDRMTSDKSSDKGKQSKSSLEAQNASLQAQVEELRFQVDEAHRSEEEAKLRYLQLSKEVEAKQLECQCLTEQTSILSSEMGLLQEEAARYREQAEDYSIQLQQLTEEIHRDQTANLSSLEQLQAQLQACTARMEQAEEAARAAAQLQLEARVVDALILWTVPCFSREGAPVSALGLWRQLQAWRAFHPSNNRKDRPNTFLQSIGAAVGQPCKMQPLNRRALAYWVSSLWWLLSLLDAEYPSCQVKRHLQSPDVLQGVRGQLQDRRAARRAMQQTWLAGQPLAEVALPCPHYAAAGAPVIRLPPADAGDKPTLSSGGATNGTAEEVCEPILLQFCTDLFLALVDALLCLVASFLEGLDDLVVPAVFPKHSAEVSKPTAGLQLFLDVVYADITANKLAGRIRDVVFHAIFSHINALLFNHFIEHQELCSLSTALHLKAVVRELEKWQTERALGKACRSSLSHLSQIANMLTIQKELLLEPATRSSVCPALTVPQVSHIVSHYRADELDAEGVSDAVKGQLEREAAAQGSAALTISTQHDVVAMTSPNIPPDAPPFVVEWLPTIGDVPEVDSAKAELPQCLLELLAAA
eukprot:EG_transcript_2686